MLRLATDFIQFRTAKLLTDFLFFKNLKFCRKLTYMQIVRAKFRFMLAKTVILLYYNYNACIRVIRIIKIKA